MNEIVKVFNDRPVRIIDNDGQQWFVGKDVCNLLGYKDWTNAMKHHCYGVAKYHPMVDSPGRIGSQHTWGWQCKGGYV